jgi:LacI family transcriptional regulator, gluconate utilization system Gnt-I transcriptional repressor
MSRHRIEDGNRLTMEDVARHAGVSAMTVSRALRSPATVNKETRERVAMSIADTGYIHNLVASALASKRSGLVAIILPTIASSMFADSIKGVSEVVRRRGGQIVIAETLYSSAEEERVVAALLGRRPDGLIIIGVSHTRRMRQLVERSGVPVVETWDSTTRPLDNLVSLSNYDAARAMTKALLDNGFRRIAFVGSMGRDHRAEMRAKGYVAALNARGIATPQIIRVDDIASMDTGTQVVEEILANPRRPEAVFFLNDVLAAGALLAFQSRGISVPGDIGVAGFGGFDLGRHLNPSLSTVHIPRYEIGCIAADILMDRIEGKVEAPINRRVEFEVLLRGSTARSRADVR